MTYKPVPKNRLQQNLNQHHRWKHAPDPYSTLEAKCEIMEVYTAEMVEQLSKSDSPPEEVINSLATNPGLLHAKVRLVNGMTVVLPFKKTVDEIFGISGGNREAMKGKFAKVVYNNLDVRNGYLEVSGITGKLPEKLSKLIETLDVFGIM